MNTELLASLAAFLVLYILLLGDWFHRAWSSLAVAGILVIAGIAPLKVLWASDNWNTLLLLIGMMTLVALLSESGFFVDLEGLATRFAGNHPWRLLWAFFVATAIASAFLDNVTTVLLLSPGLIRAAESMNLDPVPLLMVEVTASNLGGLATLIGDPPNILIGTAANLGFGQFAQNLAPLAILLLLVAMWGTRRWIRIGIRPESSLNARPVPPREQPPLFMHKPYLLMIVGLTLLTLTLQRQLHLSAGIIAIAAALFALIWTRPSLSKTLRLVDWGTIGFFLGIFVLVGALGTSGAIRQTAHLITAQNLGPWLPIVILAGSALCSALLDNVPLVAALIPVIQEILVQSPGYGLELWVALAAGAAVGGNATIIGASANVVVQGIAYENGYRLDFRRYLGFGAGIAGITILIAAIYLVLAYHIF